MWWVLEQEMEVGNIRCKLTVAAVLQHWQHSGVPSSFFHQRFHAHALILTLCISLQLHLSGLHRFMQSKVRRFVKNRRGKMGGGDVEVHTVPCLAAKSTEHTDNLFFDPFSFCSIVICDVFQIANLSLPASFTLSPKKCEISLKAKGSFNTCWFVTKQRDYVFADAWLHGSCLIANSTANCEE